MPKVSVVMPMHNGLPYIGEAVESIINQTFTNWELLVINDASTDDSPAVVRRLAAGDARIRLIDNDTGKRGSGPARNCGIEHAIGEYVMMMDADDISAPQRMERQVGFMDKHPAVALSGCWVQSFGASDRVYRSARHDWMIKVLLCFHAESWGPTIIFRRNMIKERFITASVADDTLFVSMISWRHRVANIPEKLYLYRVHSASVTRTADTYPYKKRVWQELLPMRLGFTPTEDQLKAHLAWNYGSKRGVKGNGIMDQLKWLGFALIHGRYRWYERITLGTFLFLRILYKITRKCFKTINSLCGKEQRYT